MQSVPQSILECQFRYRRWCALIVLVRLSLEHRVCGSFSPQFQLECHSGRNYMRPSAVFDPGSVPVGLEDELRAVSSVDGIIASTGNFKETSTSLSVYIA